MFCNKISERVSLQVRTYSRPVLVFFEALVPGEVYLSDVCPPPVCSLIGYFSISLQRRLSLILAERPMSTSRPQSVVHACI